MEGTAGNRLHRPQHNSVSFNSEPLMTTPSNFGSALTRELVRRIGEERQLPSDWLNDGVKGFVSARHETTTGSLPQFPNLRLTMPVPEYLLAMKCMAARVGGTSGEGSDISDIVFLIRHLRLEKASSVLALVGQYYPENRIPMRAQYLLEGLFEEGKI